MRRFDRTRPEFSPYGFTCELWTPAGMPRPDRHNEIEVNLLQAGSLTYLFGGQRTTVEAAKLAVFWAAIPHQIVAFDGDEPYFVVTWPLSEFLAAGLELDVVNRVLHGELLVESTTDACDQPKFQQWERELRTSDPACERAARLEVQARLLRFARGISERPTVRYPAPRLSRADQLACYIAQKYQEPLTSRSIAAANGLHPNYAMTLFRKAFGTTMRTFIIQHRISHAQRLLVTTGDAVLDVALAAGFQSLSRFNEAFKTACGCSPRDYRKAHRATGSARGPGSDA
jgi:AraC-like DNA-binding protein